MLFRSHTQLGTLISFGLCALMLISAAASDVSKTGYSMKVVKVARLESHDQSQLSRRGEDQITVDLNSIWNIPVQIGTPPQSFFMLPDSGSPSFSIESVFLPANESRGAPTYDPSKSSTAIQLTGYTYSNCFESGHCGNGLVYNDTITVGNLSVQMAFEVSVSNNGVGNGPVTNSGNFGLNFAQNGMTTSPRKLPTWLQTVIPLVPEPLFTMDFNESSSTGTIDFGFIDKGKYNGEISYAPVQGTDGEWGITISGFQVGSNGTFNNTQSWRAIVDSGTTSTVLPRFVIDAYFQNIPGATYNSASTTYRFPCSTVLPDFIFGIAADATYRGRVSLQNRNVGNNMCVTQLSVGATGYMIFGQNFIESQFVVFDYGNARIGFANKGSSNNTTNTTASSTVTATSTPIRTSSSTSTTSHSSAATRSNSGCEWLSCFFLITIVAMVLFNGV